MTNETTYETQNSAGRWTPLSPDQFSHVCEQAVAMDSWYAARVGRAPLTTQQEIESYLDAPKSTLQYGQDWCAVVRRVRETPPVASRPAIAHNLDVLMNGGPDEEQ